MASRGRRIGEGRFIALMQKYSAEDMRRNREELEQLILYASTDAEFARLDQLLAVARELTSSSDYEMLKFRARHRKIFIQGPPEKPQAARTRREPDEVDKAITAALQEQRHQEALVRQRGREYQMADNHIGNMTVLAKMLANPHDQVDLRKVRGRVIRAMARLPEDKGADLMRRYEEFAAKVQKLREV